MPKFSNYGKSISLEEIFPVSAVHLIVKTNRVTSVQTTGSTLKTRNEPIFNFSILSDN